MIKVVVIDTDFARNNWFSNKLSAAGFWVADSVLVPSLAIKSIAVNKPQIILISPMSNKLEGAKLALSIMEETPTPIILLYKADSVDRDEDINWCGAVASMVVPSCPFSANDEFMADLISNLQLMHIVPVVKRGFYSPKRNVPKKGKLDNTTTNKRTDIPIHHNLADKYSALKNLHCNINAVLQGSSSILPGRYSKPQIIGIASSTGGPKIVKLILNELPKNYPIPIILVQHISTGFNEALMTMLAKDSNLTVKEASAGERPIPGTVYTAPDRYHLVVSKDRTFRLLPQDVLTGHCPSATAMFTSLAEVYGVQAVGIILSGMGDDGADGLVNLRKAGGLTVAQENSSCLIDSMPSQAAFRGGIKLTLSPQDINNLLKKWISF